jgi:nucleoside-diphosphate-sugar epimerase
VNAATLSGVSGVYHVAEPHAYTWAEVVELMARAVGRPGRKVPLPATALRMAAAASEWGAGLLGRATIFNRDKAEELLAPGWLCETEPALRDLGIAPRPLADGLADTVRWYREHGWL